MFISVLLPEPDVPMIATYSPRSIVSDTPSSARTSISSVDALGIHHLDDGRHRMPPPLGGPPAGGPPVPPNPPPPNPPGPC